MKLCILMLCFLVCFSSSEESSEEKEESHLPEFKPDTTITADKKSGDGGDATTTNITMTIAADVANTTASNITMTTAADVANTTAPNITMTTAADVANTTASNIIITTAANVGTTTAHNHVTTTAKHTKYADVDKNWQKLISGYSNKTIMYRLKLLLKAAKSRGLILADKHANIGQNAAPTTAETIGQTSTVQTTGENDTTTTPSDTLPSITSTSLPDTTKESSDQDPTTGTDNGHEDPESQQPPNNGENNNPGNDDKESESHKSDTGVEKNNPGPRPLNRTPESSHFAVVFLVIIALLFGLYALYHNRQKIIAVVIEGRSVNGRGGRDRYRKLDSESGMEPEARIKNSNEVYVY